MIAVGTMITGVVLMFDPHALQDAAIGAGTRGVLDLWESLYVLGAAAMLAGLAFAAIRLEITGLLLYMAAIATNAVAIVDVAGIRGVNSALLFAAIAIACGARCYVLIKLWHISLSRRHGD